MNVVPKNAPSVTPATTPTTTAQDARSRAIAKLTGGEQPVQNATSVSPEELGALKTGEQAISDNKEDSATAASEVPETKAKEDPLSSQYATLARKEKALRAQIQQFKADQAKFEAERQSQLATPKQEFDLSKYVERDRIKADPMAIFDEVGLSYDDLTHAVLTRSQIQTDPRLTAQMARMEAEIKAAKEEAQKLRQAQEDGQKQSYQQAVAQIRSEASKLVYTDPTFEMIKETNSVPDVVELIESTFKADGVLLTVEEACQAVEDHLVEEAIKLSKIKKLQQRLAAPAAPQSPVNNTKQPQTQSKTLTNGMAAQKPMTSRERAIAAMEGRLKG